MNFRLGHDIHVWADETGTFTLTDPRRCRRYDGLCTGDIHKLEEEPSEVLDYPLHDSELSWETVGVIPKYFKPWQNLRSTSSVRQLQRK